MRATSRPVLFLAAAALAAVVTAGIVVSGRPAEVAVLEIKPRTVEQACRGPKGLGTTRCHPVLDREARFAAREDATTLGD